MNFKTICLALCTCALSFVQAQETKIAEKDRIYIESNNITFQNNAIHVAVGNNWVKTDTLYSDARGVYVDANKIGWTCSRCGWYNTTSIRYCENCDLPRN
jgi:hypothetical protein